MANLNNAQQQFAKKHLEKNGVKSVIGAIMDFKEVLVVSVEKPRKERP